MKNVKMVLALIFFLPLALIAAACSQDPIFFKISTEVAPTTPRIEGIPTAMVVFNREYAKSGGGTFSVPIMYVASSRLHWYASPQSEYLASGINHENPQWDSSEYDIPQPAAESGWKIISLAATKKYLYVLSNSDSGTAMSLKRIGHDEADWKPIGINPSDAEAEKYPIMESIYACEDYLFVGSRESGNGISCAILYLEDNPSNLFLNTLKSDTYSLMGAAFDGSSTYYLGTKDLKTDSIGSLYSFTLPTTVTLMTNADTSAPSSLPFKGIFEIKNGTSVVQVVAVTRGIQSGDKAAVFDVNTNPAGFKKIASLDKYATGALALYENTNGNLLLAGVLDSLGTSGSPRGYLEINLNTSGVLDSSSAIHDPGKPAAGTSLTTVTDTDRYAASLRKYAVNHLLQTPSEIDFKRTLFASTEKYGLWSYRVREGGEQWNAEE